MTISKGLKPLKNKKETSRVTTTIRDSGIMGGRYEIQS